MFDNLRNQISAGHQAEAEAKFRFTGGSGGLSPGGWYGLGGLLPFLPSSGFDYRREVGNLWENTNVMACINWLWRNWPDAPLIVERPVKQDKTESEKAAFERKQIWFKSAKKGFKSRIDTSMVEATDHSLTELLADPNPYYDDTVLWCGTLISLICNGNAYWRKIRSSAGKVIQLIYIPHYQIEPRWPKTGNQYIGWYEYLVDNTSEIWPVEDVVHLRTGMDPLNTRKGLSCLAAVLREVCADNEAATFAAALLRNMGVPGVIISPKQLAGEEPVELTDTQQRAFKKMWREKFGGDNRGEPFIQAIPVDVQVPGFKPSEMDVAKMRRLPEERVSALIGLPAVVVQLGAGLEHSSDRHNIETAREMAWKDCLMPMKTSIGRQIKRQLLPDMLGSRPSDLVTWDYSRVAALQQDEVERHGIIRSDWVAGVTTRGETRSQLDLETDPDKADVFYTDLVPATPVKAGAPIAATTGN